MNNNNLKLTMAVNLSEENEEKYKLYDKIISATYANIFSLSKNKMIILKNFDYDCNICRTFLEVATMVSYMTNQEIYLQCNYFDFIRARLRKKNKHIHWILPWDKVIDGIESHVVADYEAREFGVGISIFDHIFKSYYERKRSNV